MGCGASQEVEPLPPPITEEQQLLKAAETGNVEEMTRLLDKPPRVDAKGVKVPVPSANIQCKDEDGRSPLHMAAREGKLEGVKYLIQKGAQLDALNDLGWTALHSSSFFGHLDVVAELLAANAPLELQTNKGMTPLHWAAHWGHTKIINVLLDKGASLEIRNKQGFNALKCAEESKTSNEEARNVLRQRMGMQ
mmetsp:Transcript_24393/g.33603  ORF Transcript_24393/g.33603 Transcript_24393/m.33603 type:complete len:193 (+) Transcript_24393:116-694(+)|eukprot:CAMPEP_0196579420 /NCGR_PEP_ID=MMETSP1081-20130531/21878_1 /TAXON_ID=36882 /ORGANISM="Pyramimonas amylifera, Strain CCMP720" /LENGTH=192 /DNA_ID=CAMNT_0041899007 /DNA_START=111 /DNA_END=689 /DNA_ORIENTATION=-